MTIDEAIYEFQEELRCMGEGEETQFSKALMLSIEALKYVKKGREGRCPFSPSYLPGETEE